MDLLPQLKKFRAARIFYDQCHYTPQGNKVVAHALVNFLIKTRGLSFSRQPPA